MPNEAVLEQIEVAELVQPVDDGRDAADPFKLTTAMRTLVNTRLADLKAKDAATLLKEGDGPESNHVTHAVPIGP